KNSAMLNVQMPLVHNHVRLYVRNDLFIRRLVLLVLAINRECWHHICIYLTNELKEANTHEKQHDNQCASHGCVDGRFRSSRGGCKTETREEGHQKGSQTASQSH